MSSRKALAGMQSVSARNKRKIMMDTITQIKDDLKDDAELVELVQTTIATYHETKKLGTAPLPRGIRQVSDVPYKLRKALVARKLKCREDVVENFEDRKETAKVLATLILGGDPAYRLPRLQMPMQEFLQFCDERFNSIGKGVARHSCGGGGP